LTVIEKLAYRNDREKERRPMDDRSGSNPEVGRGVADVRYATMTGPKPRKADFGQGMSAWRPITEVAGRQCHFRYVPLAAGFDYH
jgi:hypothetical protein